MSKKIFCDRCNADITDGVRALYEGLHPELDKTPRFRISIEFFSQYGSNKAELCRACQIILAKTKVGELKP